MLMEIGMALLWLIPSMVVGKKIAFRIYQHTVVTILAQAGVGAVVGCGIGSVASLSAGLIVVALTAAIVAIHALTFVDSKLQNKRILSGKHGEEARWAAELAKEKDTEFIHAANNLSQMHLREVGIIAESKEELRELTIERFEEVSDDEIPSEFA